MSLKLSSWVVGLGIIALIISGRANAQIMPGGGGGYPPPTLWHELMLIVIGAVLGGFLAPVLMMIDNGIGLSPGAKQQKANYAVQREIAENIRTLVILTQRQTLPPRAPELDP
jgi:hypothetical protein